MMMANSNPVPKLYRSIIEDVIEGVREIFADEGVEEQVLKDLQKMWESKIMQSKAVEGFAKDTLNPSNFVLQLPANFSQALQKTASIVIPAGQNVQNFTTDMNSTGTSATFTLPPGVGYPVQIPAGVTLQTSSGHLYKVNVPVMVTRAPGGQRILQQPIQHLVEQRNQVGGQASIVHPNTLPVQATVIQGFPSQRKEVLQQCSTRPLLQQQQLIIGQGVQPRPAAVQQPIAVQQQVPVSQVLIQPNDFENHKSVETPRYNQQQAGVIQGSDTPPLTSDQLSSLDEIPDLQQFITNQSSDTVEVMHKDDDDGGGGVGVFVETSSKSEYSDAKTSNPEYQVECFLYSIFFCFSVMIQTKDLNYNAIEDILQLDGTYDTSSDEDVGNMREVGGNEFMGAIDREDLKALEEDGSSSTEKSSSDGEDDEPRVEIIEEDPLNSGDDVSEQDVPDLFDTDNVIVCQYDKIHRSKNRWKFYLKDGVMSFGGKDYAFSKAIGEAEW
ncbi:TFIIA-alpha and beta-like factor [Polyodon spathula]|uniref:TFIIA-alpha and beta-like factor n=1 Tax=Polyodon spathula TaxID=7913 RepID=UPI001B7DBB91|nr:TFIIA-alpha and beta-like factor [Polyodon spathula]